MVSHALALGLKRAGFRAPVEKAEAIREQGLEACYFPTIDEMIAACGENFGAIEGPREDDPHWHAYFREGNSIKLYTKGESADDAVAMLLLSIYEHHAKAIR